MAIILISGGTGLIGQKLSESLLKEGHEVRLLSRNPRPHSKIPSFYWNVEHNEIDEIAFDHVDHIIHLAGAGIADKRWTSERKKEIIESRVNSMKMISDVVKKKNMHLKSFVGTSATGIYGMNTSDKIYSETDTGQPDFLSETCEKWEEAYQAILPFCSKMCIIRTGVVLSTNGGMLKKMLPLFKLGLGSALGSGKQYIPWIHISDLVSIYHQALFNTTYEGTYNAVAPEHIMNQQFSQQLAHTLSKPFFIPKVPAFVLKLLFGEMACVILLGSRVSSKKLLDQGFHFKYPLIAEALIEQVK